MAWIESTSPAEADGELLKAYEALLDNRGKIADIMTVQSLNARAMKAHLDLYVTLMFGRSGLTREEREAIAVVVSAANGCEYCVRHHGEALNRYWKDRDKVNRLTGDLRSLDLHGRMAAILEYARKLTRLPASMTEADVDGLRDRGLSDQDILNLGLITAYFNFVNRIALGLGVEFTEDEITGYKD